MLSARGEYALATIIRGTGCVVVASVTREGWAEQLVYAELVYFEGAYFAHIVARDEHLRLRRILDFRSTSSHHRRSFLNSRHEVARTSQE